MPQRRSVPRPSPARRKRVDLHRVRDELPSAVVEVVDGYERHLALERGLSAHTVRAYVGDVGLAAGVPARPGRDRAGRGRSARARPEQGAWRRGARPASAAGVARRASGAAERAGPRWPGARRRRARSPRGRTGAGTSRRTRARGSPSPRPHRTLPSVLRQDQASDLLQASASGAAERDAVALRDHALLELLYATGIRVSELCGLDVADVDLDRRVLVVLGKGGKERTVPFGEPAARAVRDWLGVRADLRSRSLDVSTCASARRSRWQVPTCKCSTYRARSAGCNSGRARHGATRPASLCCDAFARRWCGSSERPGASWSRYARYHPAIHTRDRRTAEGDP